MEIQRWEDDGTCILPNKHHFWIGNDSLIRRSKCSNNIAFKKQNHWVLSFFLAILSRSSFDHQLRCVGWLNFEFSKREKHLGWAIKTIYKKLNRGMLKHIPLNQ